jgi:hypothetical protein
MNRSLISARTIVMLGMLCGLANQRPCMADITFSDSTFNLADYSQISYLSDPQTTLSVSQTPVDGHPGAALLILMSSPPSHSLTSMQGLINPSFVYDPAANGPLLGVSATVDKYIATSGNLTSNFFRPMILQNGDYFIAGISMSVTQGTWLSAGQSGLQASDFTLFDFNTGLFGSTHPDFSSGPMEFGLANRISLSSPPAFSSSADVRYDNLSLDLQTAPVPEPSGLTLFGLGNLGLLLVVGFKRFCSRQSKAVHHDTQGQNAGRCE